ncbi:hypothetical protein [Solicola gregarius]|uniref:Uncharacterized protein n=1 Tax=Solicola gregarius TaxID=2908642 RepID=A0AA46TJC2_9ACTN|nr:hypothetical protein [Solicola gregarius]UYM06376.1 hypothetical protein L0C25_04685 [Solicola gregarius]
MPLGEQIVGRAFPRGWLQALGCTEIETVNVAGRRVDFVLDWQQRELMGRE